MSALGRLRHHALSLAYTSALVGTSLAGQRLGRRRWTERLQRFSSDGHNLRRAPLLALAGSALFVEPDLWPVNLLFTAVALAAFERRVGARATATVFTAGHVGATLATQLPIMAGVNRGLLDESELRRIDVGASFGLYACLGAYTGVVDPRWQRVGLAAMILSLPISGATSGDAVAALGHPAAILVGMAFWPWLRRRGDRRRSVEPAPVEELDALPGPSTEVVPVP